jgi:hypothetical protein
MSKYKVLATVYCVIGKTSNQPYPVQKTGTSSCLLNNDNGADTMGIQNIYIKKGGSGM